MEQITFPSSNGEYPCHGFLMVPEQPRAVLQIVHGMAEHQRRYLPFARFLSGHGIAVCMIDHAGHGKSVLSEADYGYFGEANGADTMMADAHTLHTMIAERFPALPYYLFGHSMGSFVTRRLITRCPGGLRGAILSGTGTAPAGASAGKQIARLSSALFGRRNINPLIQLMAFGSYNRRFKRPGMTAFDWISRDEAMVQDYIDDPACGFPFTSSAFADMVGMILEVNAPEWYRQVPAELPLLLASGEMDPVGGYGQGVRTIDTKLRETGHPLVSMKLYPGARHELLNEQNRAEVMEDLLAWMEALQ